MTEDNTALEEFSRCLKALAVQIMRSARGAGNPQDIVFLARDLVVAHNAYWDEFRMGVSYGLILSILRVARDRDADQDLAIAERMHEYARDCIMSGSLQVAASRLAGQSTIESAGESEVAQGIRMLEEARAERRRVR